jgi:hypothetical protein
VKSKKFRIIGSVVVFVLLVVLTLLFSGAQPQPEEGQPQPEAQQ